MLTKMVNGETIVCSDEEEKNIKAYWDLNDRYPEYQGHCAFDGVNPPWHDMVECRKHHIKLTNHWCDGQISKLNEQIERAREDGETTVERQLMQERKHVRSLKDPDISNVMTIDALQKLLPA